MLAGAMADTEVSDTLTLLATLPATWTVVTPTLGRPDEVRDLLANLSRQTVLPGLVLLIDGADESDRRTERVVAEVAEDLPFRCRHVRYGGGTAVQRNRGIDLAEGEFIALIDDDIRLEEDFFAVLLEAFAEDRERRIGGITGYITNQHLDPKTSPRWRWYRRLRLFTTYEPGRYDFASGYPINRYLQPPHDRLREIDFMGAGCALWRREVFDDGLRFDEFFTDFGVLEDAHLALRAGRRWRLMESGRARCTHLRSQVARIDTRRLNYKTAVNYRYVFIDLVPKRTRLQEFRFWRLQIFDTLRLLAFALRRPSVAAWQAVRGKAEGIFAAARLTKDSS